jgi:hypothetical protein
MSSFSLASASTPTEQVDYLFPSPRSASLNQRTRWWRIGLLAAVLLAPNLVLGIGYMSGEDLRALAEHGRSTTGQIVLRG